MTSSLSIFEFSVGLNRCHHLHQQQQQQDSNHQQQSLSSSTDNLTTIDNQRLPPVFTTALFMPCHRSPPNLANNLRHSLGGGVSVRSSRRHSSSSSSTSGNCLDDYRS